MSDILFAKVEENFYRCLNSNHEEDMTMALEKLKASLVEAEVHSHSAKKYSKLFLEMFQFSETSSESLWAQAPKIYSAVGEFIHSRNSYEDEFREEVNRMGLGKYLEMID
ncbi:hypothetical protein [Peredibacter starrii]|uniref:Uncharacterized protein n=1 Tax=Peredibacter starrii TaxID=28202 RepID=A0AAX4HUC0_9BACT|nr:hypothetical protein [Peredibacter starrii]WPU66555.1 hypothetical protein SOO65_07335 [Peredibacter starrii]